MIKMLDFLSVCMIPLLIFYIVANGICHKRPVFEDFTDGAKNGFQIVVEIAPTIVGLIVAIGVLRNSGTLDLISQWLAPVADLFHIPSELLPVGIVKMFSASSANGLLFDLFKEHGTDSFIGFSASILLSCTETLFYTISVYFMSVGVGKARWTIPAGIFLSVFSLFVCVWIAGSICG